MKLISKNRREFVAKIIADLGKTIFAVGLASSFFEKFPGPWRAILCVGCLFLLSGSVLLEPVGMAEKEGGKRP